MSHATWIVFRALLVRLLRKTGTLLGFIGELSLFLFVLSLFFIGCIYFIPLGLSDILFVFGFYLGKIYFNNYKDSTLVAWLRRRLVFVPFQGVFLAWMFWDNAHSAHPLPISSNTGGYNFVSKLLLIQLPLYLVIIISVSLGPTLIKKLNAAWKAEYNRQFPSAHAQLRARQKL